MRPYAIGLTLLVGPLFLLLRPDGGGEMGWAACNALLFALMVLPGIVIHEAGHALAARLLGLQVHEIHIGLGRNLARRTIGDVEVWINVIPFGGLVGLSAKHPRWARLRKWLAILAGPLANLVAAIAIIAISGVDYQRADMLRGAEPIAAAFLANLYLGALNLLPICGDGNQLITLPFRRGDGADLVASGFVWRAERLRRGGDLDAALVELRAGADTVADSLAIANSISLVLMDQQDFRAARAALHELLARPGVPRLQRAVVQNNLAWVDVLIGDPDLLAEADVLSAAAHGAFGGVPAFAGTRGAVLIETGQVEAGLVLVRRALQLNTEPRSRASNAAWAAIAEARLGHGDAARRYLALAREIDPRHELLARAEAAIGDR